jgi:type III restriction enzyme
VEDELATFIEATGPDTELPGKSIQGAKNAFYFKTPLNIVIADHEPERRFIRKLIDSENAKVIDSWVKGTDRDFYPIEFSWKKGEHTKRATFNPDFFIKVGSRIFVVEIKDDAQTHDPSEENKKKAEFAREHFKRLNQQQTEVSYQFNFLSPTDFDVFFQKLRDGTIDGYQSNLDWSLTQ